MILSQVMTQLYHWASVMISDKKQGFCMIMSGNFSLQFACPGEYQFFLFFPKLQMHHGVWEYLIQKHVYVLRDYILCNNLSHKIEDFNLVMPSLILAIILVTAESY